MSEFTDWENRMAALPFERRAVEADCPGCGSTNLERGKDWIRCKPCHTKTYFEPDDPPTDTDRIAAAVAVLQSIKPDADDIYCSDQLTYEQANRISEGVDKALAILEGRDQG